MKLCVAPDCAETATHRGMCDAHYGRWRRATPADQRRRPTAEQRLWSRVDRKGPDECWPWLRSVDEQGYGHINVGRKNIRAHRLAYLVTYGVIPDQVDHTCHNNSGCPGGPNCPHRRCCNPAHLDDTTNRINCLRGESFAARHARKTHCVNGHEFSQENTLIYVWQRTGRPRRMCKACRRIRDARRKRAAA